MIITFIIYIIIISLIIFKGFYRNISFIKFFSVRKNTESLATSIQIESLPFYFNQRKINLFAFFINFFLISLISCMLIPELISNNIAYCQDYDERINGETRYITNGIFSSNRRILFDKSIIIETYDISNTNRPFIYHLNYKYIGIQDHLKVFQGLSQNIEDISNKQNFLIQKIPFITRDSYILSEIYQKSFNTLSLISNAYKNIMFSYENYKKNNLPLHHSDELLNKILHDKFLQLDEEGKIYINKIIRDFIGNYQVNNLNLKAIKIFKSLEEVQKISKENYDNLYSQRGTNIIMPEKDKIQIKNLDNYCDQNLLLTLEKELSRGEINDLIFGLEMKDSFSRHMAINNDHNYLDQDQVNIIIDKGFFFKEKLQTDRYYEPFNKDNMNENMLEKYKRFINEKELIEEEIDAFQREVEEDGF